MKTRQEVQTQNLASLAIATALKALLVFNAQGEWGRTERRAMFRAVFKAIYSLL